MKRKTRLSIVLSVAVVFGLSYFSISAFSKEYTSRGQAYEREAKRIESSKAEVGTSSFVEKKPILQQKERPERPTLGRSEVKKISGFQGKIKRVHSNGK